MLGKSRHMAKGRLLMYVSVPLGGLAVFFLKGHRLAIYFQKYNRSVQNQSEDIFSSDFKIISHPGRQLENFFLLFFPLYIRDFFSPLAKNTHPNIRYITTGNKQTVSPLRIGTYFLTYLHLQYRIVSCPVSS